jgi:Mg-chelatase subunit ChlD
VPIDFILVLDDSGSVLSSVQAMRNFAKAIVSGFDLGEDASRFAVVTFTSAATLRAEFSAARSTIGSAINQLTGSGGTSISDGLRMAQQEYTLRARPASMLRNTY